MKLKLFTVFLLIIPFILALNARLYLYLIIIPLCLISATYYHLNHEKKFLRIDTFLSLTQIAINLYFIYLAHFKFPYFYLALIFVFISFYFWFKAQKTNYNLNHSLWHIATVFITTFCILDYTNSLTK